MAMENGPFICDFPLKTSIYSGFSTAMPDDQRVPKEMSNTSGSPKLGALRHVSKLGHATVQQLHLQKDCYGHPTRVTMKNPSEYNPNICLSYYNYYNALT